MYEPKVRLLESHGSQKGRLTTWKKAHPVTSMQFVPRLMPASHDRSRTDGLTCLPRLASLVRSSDRIGSHESESSGSRWTFLLRRWTNGL